MKRILFCSLLAAASLNATPIVLADGEINEFSSLDGQQSTRIWDLGSGVMMTVQAFSLIGSTFTSATTTQFGSNAPGELAAVGTLGLGMCGSTEVCWFNQWQIDNTDPGGRDFLLFTFSSPVNLGGLVIRQTTINNTDSDAGYATGTGNTLAALLSGLTTSAGPNMNVGDSRTVQINANNVTQLLFGTLGTDRDDFFKAYSLDVTLAELPPPPVSDAPEPATFALLGGALSLLGLMRRRFVS